MKIISKSFFGKSTVEVAKNLLGKFIVRETSNGIVVGKIVETEAYLENDPASHSFCGQTKRNAPMFENAGTAYVYFTYGMYYCFNVVTSKKGCGEAVLIRAIEPIQGLEIIKKNRGNIDDKNLCNGPARLTLALAIGKNFNGINLLDKTSSLKLMENTDDKMPEIIQTTRIGISKGIELPHRFYIKGSKWVSRK